MTPSQAIARTREVIRRQYKALATEESYVHWVRRYIAALQRMPGFPANRSSNAFSPYCNLLPRLLVLFLRVWCVPAWRASR
jgi:hypothetical protein